MSRDSGYLPLKPQKAFVNETAYYNNIPGDSIPIKGEKVKEFYQCRRHCANCGYEGVTSHEMGLSAPDEVKCPNCKVHFVFTKKG